MDTLGNCKEKMAKRRIGLRQGLNKVARSVPGSGPRAAQATLGATASPLGQPLGRCGLPVKARQPAEKSIKMALHRRIHCPIQGIGNGSMPTLKGTAELDRGADLWICIRRTG